MSVALQEESLRLDCAPTINKLLESTFGISLTLQRILVQLFLYLAESCQEPQELEFFVTEL